MLRATGAVAAILVVTGLATAAVAPPPNDNRAGASPVNPPASVRGTTVGATDEATDPRPSCGRVHSTVWYSITSAPGRRIVLRLHADGDLDGVLAVYQVQRSRLTQVTCDATDQTQLWTVRANSQIANPATSKCLTAGSGGVALGACFVVSPFGGTIFWPSSTFWKFHAQL